MTLNSAEQREHTQLQQQIAAYRKRHDQFAEVIANAQQTVEQLAVDKQAKLKALPDANDPLKAYREIEGIQGKLRLHKAFIQDAKALLPSLMDEAKPLLSRQSDINRHADSRMARIRRLQEEIDRFGERGLGTDDHAMFDRLQAEQNL